MSQIIQDKINALQASYVGGIYIDPVKSVLTDLNVDPILNRFGIEDSTSSVNRNVNFNNNNLTLNNVNTFNLNYSKYFFANQLEALALNIINPTSGFKHDLYFSGATSVWSSNDGLPNSIGGGIVQYVDPVYGGITLEYHGANGVSQQRISVNQDKTVYDNLVNGVPRRVNFPRPLESEHYFATSVNGNYADTTGNITLPTGGTASRFGIEDNTGVQSRLIDMASFPLSIANGDINFTGTGTVSINKGLHLNNASAKILNGTLFLTDDNFGVDLFMGPKTAFRTINLPDANGVLAMSVNGVVADSTGNITIPTGGGGGGTTVTATNGLTKTLDNVELGGILTKTTTIDANSNSFSVENASVVSFQSGDVNGINQNTQLYTTNAGAVIYSQLNSNGIYSRVNINNNSIEISTTNNQNYSRLNLFNNGNFNLSGDGNGFIESLNLLVNVGNELTIQLPNGSGPGFVLTDVLGDGKATWQPGGGNFVPMVGTAAVGPISGTLEFQAKEYSGGTGELFGFVAAPSPGSTRFLMNGVGYDYNYRINQKGAFTQYRSGTSGALGSEVTQFATTGLGNQSARQTTKADFDQGYAAVYLEAQTNANTTRFTVQTSTGAGYAPTLGTTLFDNTPGSRGIRGLQDFTPNIQALDYVQKKYVDNLVAVNGSYIQVTKAQLDAAITASTLVKGATYKVVDTHVSLYDDGTSSGTTIYIRALENNKVSTSGVGRFFNPKYNLAVNDFGIWNNMSYMTASIPVTGVFRPNEIITANNGAVATLISGFSINKIFFTVTSGDWSTATSATNATGVSTNLSVPVIRAYAIGAKVIWGGYTWTNNTGNVGASTSIFALNTEWTKIAYNLTDYNEVYNPIIYDYTNNIITSRTDEYNNTVQYHFRDISYFNALSLIGNPINVFQWGNKFSQGNIVHSSYLENINTMGEIGYNQLYSQSIMANNFMFTNIVIVEQSNVLLYHNHLSMKSEMRNNRMIESSAMFRNTILSSSTISGNLLYAAASIRVNYIDATSFINSNEIRRGIWTLNKLKDGSTISSNLSNYNTGHIRNNDLDIGSTINSNNFNNVYIQAVGSDRMFIYNNKLNFAQINSNTLINVANGRGSYIGSCVLSGDNSADGQIRLSGIYTSTIAAYTQTTYLRMCTLKAAQMLNVNIDNVNDFRFIDLEDYVWNFNNVITTNRGKLDGVKANSKSITASFAKVFNGGIGAGAIGDVLISTLEAPTGYFIEEVIIDVQVPLVGTGAILNLGLAVDNTQSGINNTTGDIATLNTAGITKIVHSTFTKAVATRAILMEVKTAAITSGTIGITLRLSKL